MKYAWRWICPMNHMIDKMWQMWPFLWQTTRLNFRFRIKLRAKRSISITRTGTDLKGTKDSGKDF